MTSDNVEARLAKLRLLYDQSGEPREGERGQKFERANPVFAWRAYRLTRRAHESVPVPEWVLRYFDRVADAMLELEFETPARTATALPAALELDYPPRTSAAGKRARDLVRQLHVAGCVHALIYKDPKRPLPQNHACEAVAQELGMTKSTAAKYYRRFREAITCV